MSVLESRSTKEGIIFQGKKLTLLDIFELGQKYSVFLMFLAVLFMSLVQVSPIQINPWTWTSRKIRSILGITDAINSIKSLKSHIDELDAKLDSLQMEGKEQRKLDKALDARRRILVFNDEILQNIRHSQERFTNVLEDITFYENYCESHRNFVNQKAVMAESNIKRVYQKCMEEHDFL